MKNNLGSKLLEPETCPRFMGVQKSKCSNNFERRLFRRK